jgi:hypothetical protein
VKLVAIAENPTRKFCVGIRSGNPLTAHDIERHGQPFRGVAAPENASKFDRLRSE